MKISKIRIHNYRSIIDAEIEANDCLMLIRDRKNHYTLAVPFKFNKCLEKHLNLSFPERDDQRPPQILKALEDNTITTEQLAELGQAFCKSLAILEVQ